MPFEFLLVGPRAQWLKPKLKGSKQGRGCTKCIICIFLHIPDSWKFCCLHNLHFFHDEKLEKMCIFCISFARFDLPGSGIFSGPLKEISLSLESTDILKLHAPLLGLNLHLQFLNWCNEIYITTMPRCKFVPHLLWCVRLLTFRNFLTNVQTPFAHFSVFFGWERTCEWFAQKMHCVALNPTQNVNNINPMVFLLTVRWDFKDLRVVLYLNGFVFGRKIKIL